MLTAIIVIISLSILILGHEAGHFLVAKIMGMKVEEFGFGFPPRILGWRRYKGETAEEVGVQKEISVSIEEMGKGTITEEIVEREVEVVRLRPVRKSLLFWGSEMPPEEIAGTEGNTIYSLNSLPFGGFVKIAGENDRIQGNIEKLQALPDAEKKRFFFFQSAWRRSLVMLAGVTVNFLIGWFLLAAVYAVGTGPNLAVYMVQPDSPAAKIGLLPGDIIRNFATAEDFIRFVNQHRGEEINIDINRGNTPMSFKVVPRLKTETHEGPVGIVFSGIVPRGFFAAVGDGFLTAIDMVGMVFAGLYMLLKSVVLTGLIPGGIVGPVGIFVIAQETGSAGLIYLLQLIAFISINLAVVNLIPFPALDGGRFLLVLIEKFKGTPIPVKAEAWINGVGFALLILLMVVITIRDVIRL